MLGYFVEVTAGAGAGARTANGERGKIHPSADAGERHALHDDGACRARAEDRQRRRPGARDRAVDLRRCSPGGSRRRSRRSARVARALAEIDVASALAELAASENYVRPKVDSSLALPDRGRAASGRGAGAPGGRAELCRQRLRSRARSKVSRPARTVRTRSTLSDSDAGRIWLLTGPNMAGKSTFLRQNALIAILAQAGSFVPAKAAHIGIVDAVFSPRRRGRRSGARALDLHGGDGGDGGDPEPGGAARARHPRRDRPRHGDLRRALHRLGDGRASARDELLRARSSPRTITS